MDADRPPHNGTLRVESRNPRTGRILAEYDETPANEVTLLVDRARGAQQQWRSTPVPLRVAALQRFRRLVVERRDELSQALSAEQGKPHAEALMELVAAGDFAKYYSRISPEVLRTRSKRAANLALWRKTVLTEYEPLGVVGIISPWNYPFLLPAGIAIPALAAGNGVVLKPSELTPTTALLLREVLIEAGVPQSLIAIAPGAAATGQALISSGVDKIFFIGSAGTGRKVASAAARLMVPCVLELGGSDPAIVLDDADIGNAALGIAWGRFTNAGQTCVAPKRVFVLASVYDSFLEQLSAIVGRSGEAPDRDTGPLIRPLQRRRLLEQLDDALRNGARIAAQAAERDSESYFPPTLLVDVEPGMKVLQEETFGPLLPIVRVADADEAVRRANQSMYGLSASIWSRNIERAVELAGQIEAGTVTINDSVIVPAVANISYGGYKSSGIGHSHGEAGLLECVRPRSIIIDKFPSWRETYWHGYGERVRRGFDAFLVLAHGSGFIRRIAAAARVVRLLYFGRSESSPEEVIPPVGKGREDQ